MPHRRAVLFLAIGPLVAALMGCTGNYILTVPDQVAPAGGQAVCVVRLQRSEVALIALPVEGALIMFHAPGDERGRGAYTDKLGYAGTTVPVRAGAGRHVLRVCHQDRQGDEAFGEVPLYVWDVGRPAVAVDLESLPTSGKAASAAREALARLAEGAALCYMTRRPVSAHAAAHKDLARAGYPDGPILLWRQESWHIVREGKGLVKVPRVVVESRLVSQLAYLRKVFPALTVGVTDNAASAKAFAEAGMRAIVVGGATAPGASRAASWADVTRE